MPARLAWAALLTTTATTLPRAALPLSLPSLAARRWRLRPRPTWGNMAALATAAAQAGETPSPEDVGANYAAVLARVAAASEAAELAAVPRLVAVSKTKPVALLEGAYAAGARDFGENYAQELLEKAPQLPDDIRWRFIGHLQSNKCKPLLARVPGLVCVETVDTEKLARKLDAACAAAGREGEDARLGVMVQVNTSGEDSKSGVAPREGALELASFIASDACPHLRLDGFMTIGAPGDDGAFGVLAETRDLVAEALGVDAAGLELSMGMSGDFETAIAFKSNSVRVGSSIFGARAYPNKA